MCPLVVTLIIIILVLSIPCSYMMGTIRGIALSNPKKEIRGIRDGN